MSAILRHNIKTVVEELFSCWSGGDYWLPVTDANELLCFSQIALGLLNPDSRKLILAISECESSSLFGRDTVHILSCALSDACMFLVLRLPKYQKKVAGWQIQIHQVGGHSVRILRALIVENCVWMFWCYCWRTQTVRRGLCSREAVRRKQESRCPSPPPCGCTSAWFRNLWHSYTCNSYYEIGTGNHFVYNGLAGGFSNLLEWLNYA